MLLVGSAGTDSAEAARIINDLRSLKGAASMFYFEEGRYPLPGSADDAGRLDDFSDRPMCERYSVVIDEFTAGGNTHLTIGITLPSGAGNAKIKAKLESRAMEAGLIDRNGGIYNSAATDSDRIFVQMN